MSGPPAVTVQITLTSDPPGTLAAVELHFHGGLLAGLTLTGFRLVTRRDGRGPLLTVPTRYRTTPSRGRTRSAITTPTPILRPLDAAQRAPYAALRQAMLAAYDEVLLGPCAAR